MSCLITGGAGAIGSYLAECLVARGDKVAVYDNFSSGRRGFLKNVLGKKNFSLIEGDMLDLPALRFDQRAAGRADSPETRSGPAGVSRQPA